MAEAQEKKGDDLVAQAEKKLKGWGFFGGKYDDAAELLEKAGTSYKVAKAWDKAAETYLRISELQSKHLDSTHEAASNLVEAANCFKKTKPAEAQKCLEKAVDLFVDNGRLSMAARHCKDMGEMYEKEEDTAKARLWYSKAADFYASESAQSSVNQMRLKVAEFAALDADYTAACEIYESVAKDSLGSKLLSYSVKNYLLNAGICQLCKPDAVAVQNALEKYQDLDPTFSDTREYKLLSALAEAKDQGDQDAFTEAIKEFDSMTRLDAWKTTLLLRAKNLLQDEEESLT